MLRQTTRLGGKYDEKKSAAA